MAIKVERNIQTKFSAKGTLSEITAEGFSIIDEKEGTTDLLKFADLKELVGKSITIAVASKEDAE